MPTCSIFDDNVITVDQESIKILLAEGKNPYMIEKLIGIPRSVSIMIAAGKDRPFYKKRGKRRIKNMCTACGRREKGNGLRFLCEICFKLNREPRRTIAH